MRAEAGLEPISDDVVAAPDPLAAPVQVVATAPPVGDDFRLLFQSVIGALHGFVARQCPPAEAVDITAEILTEVFAHWANAPNSLSEQRKWVFGFARNKLKEDARRHAYSVSAAQLVAANQPQAYSFDELTAANDRVRRILHRLPEKEREAVTLTVFAGFTAREAADILGINTSAVTTRVSRARKHLKRIIESEDD
jgi:RNA polymerase sigma-70 factor, ECF subfamily